jgi:DNA-binding beta-propeller fold protein YncE
MLLSAKSSNLKKPLSVCGLVFYLAVTMFNCGCGSQRGELFVELDRPVLWPPPPEQPRIKHLGLLSSEADLKKEVSGLEAFGQLVFGKDQIGVLNSPRGVILDENERLFIADASGAVIHMMDLRTREYRQFSKLGGELKLLSPIDLTIVNNNIYVSDSILGRICVFDLEGNYKFSFGSDMLRRPAGIAYSTKQQKIYVADTIRHVIDVFDIEGRLLQEIGGRGSGRGYFNFPTYLWIDKADKLYVSDTLNYRIQVFAPDGEVLLTFGQHGNRPGYFAHPCGLATDNSGNIYVSDKQFENIQIFNSQGQILMAVGGEGRGPGQFWLPSGIFIDKKNRIFVADSFNKRIQVLQLLEAQEQ